jgi:hypothetical protein
MIDEELQVRKGLAAFVLRCVIGNGGIIDRVNEIAPSEDTIASAMIPFPRDPGAENLLRKLLRDPGSVLLAQFADHNDALVRNDNRSLLVCQLDLVASSHAPFSVRVLRRRRGLENGAEVGGVEVPERRRVRALGQNTAIEEEEADNNKHGG